MRELPHTHSCFVCGDANAGGLKLRFETDGRIVRARFVPRAEHIGFKQTVHGGIIATVLDSVMGCAVHTKLPLGRTYTTLEIKVNYLRGVNRETGPMSAVGWVVHLGRQTAMAEGSLSDARGRLFAQASTTCLIFRSSARTSPSRSPGSGRSSRWSSPPARATPTVC